MGPTSCGLLVAKDHKGPESTLVNGTSLFYGSQLDLSGAAQGLTGAGGDWAALFSPDFIVHYMIYWSTRPDP